MTSPAFDNSHDIPAAAFERSLLSRQPAATAAMQRVLRSGQLILGSEVAKFEAEFADFVGAEYCIGVASGTDALILALRALEIERDDEVICTANGPVPTVAAIRAVGAVPRFVDIDRETMQLDSQRIESAITSRTRCLLPVHLYGCPVDMRPLIDLANNRNLLVIEDCAQAHGAQYDDQHVGTIGSIGCFSFYPTKNLGALGDGGACVTNDAKLNQRLRELRMYGFRERAVAERDGLNSRLDELQAAFLREALVTLNDQLARRESHASAYLSRLNSQRLRLPHVTTSSKAAWHQFVVRSSSRDAIQHQLREQSVNCGIHYAWPVHLMPAYADLGYACGSLPVTEQTCGEVLSLPIIPELTDAEITCVVDAVNRVTSTLRPS